MKTTTRTTTTEIATALREDGYDPALALAVRRAARAGALLWTRDRLTSTDASRIDARPR